MHDLLRGSSAVLGRARSGGSDKSRAWLGCLTELTGAMSELRRIRSFITSALQSSSLLAAAPQQQVACGSIFHNPNTSPACTTNSI